MFDLSNFSKGSKIYDNQNEMNNEYREIPINKFVGLKSKTHSMLSDGNKESSTTKVVNITTEFNEFRDSLFNKKVQNEKN